MVERMFNLIYREIKGLHQAAYILALFTLASQLLAIVRDRVLAHRFGAGAELDIYYAAFKIPDLLFVLFASVLSVYVLLPFVMKAQSEGSETARNLLSQFFSIFVLFYIGAAALVWLFASSLVSLLFIGFSSEMQVEVVQLMRLLLLQPLLLGVSSLFGVITQMHHRFVVYAISPLIYNFGIIFGVAVLFDWFGLAGLAFGVLLGASGHMLVQLPFVYKTKIIPRFTFNFDLILFKKVAKVAFPRAVTLSLTQIQLTFFVFLASIMSVGSVTVMQFANNLYAVPLSIIGASYSVAAFPTLSALITHNKLSEFSSYVLTALRHIIFWGLPAIAFIIVLRAHIVRLVLGSGAFDWDATRLTAAVLAIFILALVLQSMLLVMLRAFYAGGRAGIPLLLMSIGTGIGTYCAFLLYKLFIHNQAVLTMFSEVFRIKDVSGGVVLAIPAGFVIGIIIEFILMAIAFTIIFKMSWGALLRPAIVAFCAAAAGGLAMYVTLQFVVEGVNQAKFVGVFLQATSAFVVGVITTTLTYYLFRSPELHEIGRSFKSKIFKTNVVTPQPDVL
jgi:putative peptidoglycan lipid II flippase